HIKHPGASRLFGNRILCLALGPHEEHDLALGRQVLHKLRRFLEHLQRFLQVDDVNPVALSEDVFLHLGIPALRLMPEVNSRFEQLLHGDSSQLTSYLVCIGNSKRFPDCHSRPRTGAREELNTSKSAFSLQLSAFSKS